MKFRLGTRKSALAMVQSQSVLEALRHVGVLCELVPIESEGDKDLITPLYEIQNQTPGLFTKQLETALLKNEIDLAVHSLKDLPTDQPEGLIVQAVTKRASVGDCLLINQNKFSLSEILHLPTGATVGTSALRREALLLSQRPDLKIVSIRGNVPTRVQLVRDGKVDAVVLALAGIERLGLSMHGVRRVDMPEDIFISAPGQGALAIETRRDVNERLLLGIAKLNCPIALVETRVERSILKGLFGGCTLPLGVRCRYDSKNLKCKAFLGISNDRKLHQHSWNSFHHFDISDAVEQSLVSKVIEHFKIELAFKGHMHD